jgi:hypothetical protein
MSKLSLALISQMDEMSEREFRDMLGLSKSAFLDHVKEMADFEAQCAAETGSPAPDFTAHLLGEDGGISDDLVTLSDLPERPIALIFGCYTCPIFRRQMDRFREIIRHFEDRVLFLFVYVVEAHPTDGWNTPSNVEAGIMYAQPQDMAGRASIARDWRRAFGVDAPVALDWPDNGINAAWAGSPERLYVLDARKIVTFKSDQGPFEDAHLEDWAAALEKVA